MSITKRHTMLSRTGATGGERSLAAALRRSPMPVLSPGVAGLQLAARYLTAQGDVGRDWYDVFALPCERVGIVIGDAVGHGVAAAMIMARLRFLLHSSALEHAGPAAVLRSLDDQVRCFESGATATVLYGVTQPPYDVVDFSSAGHLPPMLISAGIPSRLLDVPPDLPVGVADGTRTRRTTSIAFATGTTLCLFTDGLVDQRADPARRLTSIDDLLDALCRAATADEPEAALDRIMATLPKRSRPPDDVTLLAIRRL